MTESTEQAPSYHDVYVTTANIERARLFDLPYGYELTCNRVGGWTLWGPHEEQIAAEYGDGLRVDVAGACDLRLADAERRPLTVTITARSGRP